MKRLGLIVCWFLLVGAVFYSTTNGDFHDRNIWTPRPTNGDFQNSQNTFVVSAGDTLTVNTQLRAITLDIQGVLIFNTSNVQINDTLFIRDGATVITNGNLIDLGNTYLVQENGASIDTTGGGNIVSNFPTLPVELVEFTATHVNDSVYITWKTLSERDNYGFKLYRVINNRKDKYIGFTPGMGTSYNEVSYNSVDFLADRRYGVGDTIQYALVQYDFDTKFEIFYTLPVNTPVKKNRQTDVYPNPVSRYDRLHVYIPQSTAKISNYTVDVSIYDVTGRLVHIVRYNQNIGSYIVLKNYGVSAGVYFVRVQNGNAIKTHKIAVYD